MRSFTCVSVVVYVARKLRPCPSYSRRRDRINLVLWRSLDKGGGGGMNGMNMKWCERVSALCHPSGLPWFSRVDANLLRGSVW